MSQLLEIRGSSPLKGWVRDAILTVLSKGPSTATEIAKELRVSKATVSYHTKTLLRRDMIEIADIKSIRGGVYSKTYALKHGGLVLARRRDEQEGALGRLDELFEKLLVSWHLEPTRKPADEIEIFLYHLFRLTADSGSMNDAVFEGFGERVGHELIAPFVKFSTMKSGLKALVGYLEDQNMAHLTLETRKRGDSMIHCSGCFENKEYGSLVCSFTRGMLTGAIKGKHSGRTSIQRLDQKEGGGSSACIYEVKTRGFKE